MALNTLQPREVAVVNARANRRTWLWTARGHEKDRLAWHRRARAAVCGCQRCDDSDRGEELDVLIAVCTQRIAELEDQLCER